MQNRDQTDKSVRYYAQGNRRGFYLTREEVMLSLEKETRGLALALRFVGSNPGVVVEGEERAPGEHERRHDEHAEHDDHAHVVPRDREDRAEEELEEPHVQAVRARDQHDTERDPRVEDERQRLVARGPAP